MKSLTEAASDYREALTKAPRTLPVALAHVLAVTRLSEPERLELLNKLFRSLRGADQIRCRRELAACRAARRGETLAELVT